MQSHERKPHNPADLADTRSRIARRFSDASRCLASQGDQCRPGGRTWGRIGSCVAEFHSFRALDFRGQNVEVILKYAFVMIIVCLPAQDLQVLL